jgi:aminomethyltransferase
MTLRHTPLFEEHVARGARMVPFAGWQMPVQYTGIVDEHRAVRTKAGLFDVCHMGELELSGEYAAAVVDYLVVSDVKHLSDGQACYTCALNERGTILDDLIVYRLAYDRFLVVCNASNRNKMAEVFRNAADHHCDFVDRSDQMALLALQGPLALEVLAKVGGDAPKRFFLRDSVVANVRCSVARTGYTGEDGVELFCAWGDVPQLFRMLLHVGEPMGLKPVGLGARDTLRLEARLSLYGNDIDETTNPMEAGLGWIVHLSKGLFVGSEALEALGPSTRALVGFEVTGRGVARHGYPLWSVDGAEVGVCTSGSPSPTLGKNIGLGYVPVGLSAVGTRLLVDCRGKQIDAVVVKTPFYKRGTAR